MLAGARELGDLGLTAERLLGELKDRRSGRPGGRGGVRGPARDRHDQGTGSQGRKLTGLVDLLARATPLEARYWCVPVPATCAKASAPPPFWTPWPRSMPAAARPARCWNEAYNICSDLSLVAATLVSGGLAAVEAMEVRAGNPVRPMLAQLQRAGRDPGQAGRELRGRVQVRRHPGAGPPHIGWPPGAVHRRLDRVSTSSPR